MRAASRDAGGHWSRERDLHVTTICAAARRMEHAAFGGNENRMTRWPSRFASMGRMALGRRVADRACRRLSAAAPARPRARRVGDLRRRLLLVRGGRFRQGAGRAQHDLRLHRRQGRRTRPTSRFPPAAPATPRRSRSSIDPAKVSYRKLLDVFWRNIDPLAKDRSSAIAATSTAPAIFYHDEEQKKLAEESKKTVAGEIRAARGQTEIVKAGTFYKAEDYHQDYYKKNPSALQILPLELRARSAARGAVGQADKSS